MEMVDLRNQYLAIKDEVDSAIFSVLEGCSFINGPAVQEFGKNLAKKCEVDNVITCANGTDALQISLMALNLNPGDEIIVPAHTYVATAEAIALLNLKPVFVDVNRDTFNIDVEKVESVISDKTRAIVPVHLYGQCADMEPLLKIANECGICVIEDTAQAIGAKYKFSNGTIKQAGTMGDLGCLSFFPSKNLGCYGDGGAILVGDDELASNVRMIANHGQNIKYHHQIVGCNSRLDSIQAAILNVKLKYLDRYNKNRQEVAERYDDGLKGIDGIITPYVSDNCTHVYHQYTLRIIGNSRDKFQEELKKNGIPTMIYYPIPLHKQVAYNHITNMSFEVTEELSEQVLSLPIHTEMKEDDQNKIIESIIKIRKKI